MKKTYPQEYYKKLNSIAAFIKEYRLNSGYTQTELAEYLNLHRNTLSRAEGAKNMTVLTDVKTSCNQKSDVLSDFRLV